jgi:hypothetical protein
MLPGMTPLVPLPDGPHNAALLDWLRGQAVPPAGPQDYALGAWQLHAHPDLLGRLREVAPPGWPLAAAYGVPLLASEGVAAVVALGTSGLAVRDEARPPGAAAAEPPGPFIAGWSFIGPWPADLPLAAGTLAVRRLVRDALRHAGDLAASRPG